MKELLEKVYQDNIEKPESYHFVCYGGSTIKLVDIFLGKDTYQCRFQGDDNWMSPACKTCNGLTVYEKTLTEYQENINYGMTILYEALKRELTNKTKL